MRDSPALTGTPTPETTAAGRDIATAAFVAAKVVPLVGFAPDALKHWPPGRDTIIKVVFVINAPQKYYLKRIYKRYQDFLIMTA
ncbi:hypothetical protein DHU18_21085 [Salmonella enterica]|nr:hypothetical protein [Salmonella enterica]